MYLAIVNRDGEIENVTLINGNANICFEPGSGNRYDVEYQAWLAAGNQPEVVQPGAVIDVPTIDERVEAVELMVDLILDTQTGGA